MSPRRRPIVPAALAALTLAALQATGPARAGDGPGPPPAPESAAALPDPDASPLRWWSVPRRARSTLRRMAAAQDASVSRCLLIERDGQVTYEVHAARRRGLLRKEEFVLTRFTEPEAEASARREARSLRGRLGRLRQSVSRDR